MPVSRSLRRLPAVLVAFGLAVAAPAAAQHSGSGHHGAHADAPGGIETFEVSGLRVDEAAPPPGSGVGRAGLRFPDGGYVSVVYGKPYARGRVVFGGVVAYDAVWSAGAHRSTELVTTVPLAIGRATLAPGAYSLLATPGRAAWTLHLNARLGMHLADEYDPAQDVLQLTVPVEALAEPVEALTYTFTQDGGLGLRLAWGDVAVTLPFARAE